MVKLTPGLRPKLPKRNRKSDRMPERDPDISVPHTPGSQTPKTPEQEELGQLSGSVSNPNLKEQLAGKAKVSVLGEEEAKKLDEAGSAKKYLKDRGIREAAEGVFGEDAEKVLDFYKEAKEKDKKHPIRHTLRKMLTKRVLGFSAFSILLPIIIIGTLVFFFSYLYKPEHVKQYLIDVHLARFNLQLTRRVGQLITSEALVSAESTGRLNPIRRGGVTDLLVGYNPQTALERLGRTGEMQFDMRSRRQWNLRRANDVRAVTFKDGTTVELPRNANAAQRAEFRRGIETKSMEVYAMKNKWFRGKVLRDIRRQFGIKLFSFKNLGRIYQDKAKPLARKLFAKEQDEAVRGTEVIDSNDPTTRDTSNTTQDEISNGDFIDPLPDSDGDVATPYRERFLTRVKTSFDAHPYYSALKTVSIVNAAATILCLIYEAYVQNVEKVIENRSAEYIRLAGKSFSCADQMDYGDVTTEAVQVCADSYNGFEKSTEYRTGQGKPSLGEEYDLPEELYPQKVMGEAPDDIKNLVNNNYSLGGASGIGDIDDVCSIILNPIAQTVTAVAEIALALYSLGVTEVGAQSAYQAIKAGVPKLLTRAGGTRLAASTTRNLAATVFLTDYLMPKIVESYTGGANGSQEQAGTSFNKNGAGAELLGQEILRQAGGAPLTSDQIVSYNLELNRIQKEEDTRRSWYARLFDLKNTRSAVAQFVIQVPTSGYGIKDKTTEMMASINPFTFVSKKVASLREKSQPIWAISGEGPYGISQFGLPLDILNKCDTDTTWCPRENAAIVEPQFDQLEERYGECFSESTAKLVSNTAAYPDCFDENSSDSLINSEMGQRFVLYKFDTAVLENSIYEQNDEDDSGLDEPTPGPSGANSGGPPFSTECSPMDGQPPLPPAVPMEGNAPGIMIVPEVTSAGGNRVSPGVREDVAQCVQNMLATAEQEGITLTGSGFRDLAGQLLAGQRNGCPPNWTSSSECNVPTAPVGTSNHGWGVAIDFSTYNFSWLSANAGEFGFYNLPSESWHWSINGN